MSTNTSPNVVGVLDNAVDDIVRHSGYLTTGNIDRLLGVFPESVRKRLDGKDIPTADKMVGRMVAMTERLYESSLGSTDPDTMKTVTTSLKNTTDMLIRHAKTIDHQKRAVAVEEALVASLDDIVDKYDLPELKETYLRYLERHLSDADIDDPDSSDE